MPTQSNLDTWDLVAITDSEITFETIHVLSPRTSPKETKIATSILNRTIDSIPKEPLSNKVTFVDIQIEEEPQAKKELSENIESPPLQNSCLKKTCAKIRSFFSKHLLKNWFFFVKKRKN